jgi:transposase
VRRRTTWIARSPLTGCRPGVGEPPRPLSGYERLSAKALVKLWNSLIDTDRSGQILAAWIAREELHKLLALARTNPPRVQIAAQIYLFYAWCASISIVEITPRTRPSRPGGPRSKRSVDNGIANAKPNDSTHSSNRSDAQAAGLETSPTTARMVSLHSDPPSSNSGVKIIARSSFKNQLRGGQIAKLVA